MTRLKDITQESLNILQEDEQACPIYKTCNYDQFGHIGGNRAINPTNYAKLESSMLEEQLIIPICVNKNKQIIDGQHRFEVCKNNNLPVYYYVVEDYEIDQVKRANMVSRTWTKKDFLSMQVEQQKESYIVFNYLIDAYKVNIQDLLKIFALLQKSNLSLIGKAFEEGNFVEDCSEEVEAFLKALQDFKGFRYYCTSQFVGAFSKLYFYEEYDHKKMVERLKRRGDILTKKPTTDEYVMALTREIYSFGPTRNPIYYDHINKKFYK